jgi:succinylglutamate desuccinylase
MRGKINGDLPKELLRSIASIRHTAIHRLRTNSTGLEQFLADAEELVGVLGDTVYAKAISHLRSDAQSTLMELTRNKQFIQLQLERAQGEIAKQRAKLDQEEQEVLRYIAKEDEKYRVLAGDRLKNALELIEDFKIATDREDTVLNGINGFETNAVYGDDSDVDYADQFEDYDETWFP